MLSNQDLEFLRRHLGKIIAGIAALILGILFATIGFLKTIFVIFLVVIAILAGYLVDNPDVARRFLNKYLGR
jgi:uncharacterized membrane protein